MAKLSQVWLFANACTGSIPDLSKCLNLFDLQLRDNRLTGVLPLSLTELPKLINISLQNNKLQGQFPEFKSGVSATLGDTNSFCTSTPGPCDHEVNVLLAVAGALGYPMSLAEAWTENDACAKWTFVTCDSQVSSLPLLSKDEKGKKSGSGSGLWSVIVGSEGSSTPSMTVIVVFAIFVNTR
ncbi:hypothetical protein POM88_007537 [Heracleum sosnowskyi]|uniref:Leucine-rich repeat-containing N-terminal plant-type domain-containing protein n=1 Tax=Heracleum sosnowskyi TaxID=360622 RepID=A0AAD8J4X0_9APIA|nr:hypothetical protein POM88_007537 [Heracleum sosnowskyi]